MSLLVFRLAPLDPLFQQVFIVTVCPGTEREDSFVGELAAVGVDEHGHQAVVFAGQLVDEPHYLIRNILKKSREKDDIRTLSVEPTNLRSLTDGVWADKF